MESRGLKTTCTVADLTDASHHLQSYVLISVCMAVRQVMEGKQQETGE